MKALLLITAALSLFSTIALADVPVSPVTLITLSPGSSAIIETRNGGFVQYACPALPISAPLPASTSGTTQAWTCSKSFDYQDGMGHHYPATISSISTASALQAFLALKSTCAQQIATQVPNADTESTCAALTYADVKCTTIP